MTVSSAAKKGWQLWQCTERRMLAVCTAQPGLQDLRSSDVDTVARVYNPSSGFQDNIQNLMCWCCKIKVLSKLVWWYRINIVSKVICNRCPLLLFFPLFFLLLFWNKYFMLFLCFHSEFYSSGFFFFLLLLMSLNFLLCCNLLNFLLFSSLLQSCLHGFLSLWRLCFQVIHFMWLSHCFPFFILHPGDKEN